jgi:hypothetical protein
LGLSYIRLVGKQVEGEKRFTENIVSYRLTNQTNPRKVLTMSNEAWFSILELAEEYGWNPLGTFSPGWWLEPGDYLAASLEWSQDGLGGRIPPWDGSYTTRVDESRIVMLEDALNLSDALEAAILEYEPEPVYKFAGASLSLLPRLGFGAHTRPGIGAITALRDFCRQGAFIFDRIP